MPWLQWSRAKRKLEFKRKKSHGNTGCTCQRILCSLYSVNGLLYFKRLMSHPLKIKNKQPEKTGGSGIDFLKSTKVKLVTTFLIFLHSPSCTLLTLSIFPLKKPYYSGRSDLNSCLICGFHKPFKEYFKIKKQQHTFNSMTFESVVSSLTLKWTTCQPAYLCLSFHSPATIIRINANWMNEHCSLHKGEFIIPWWSLTHNKFII